MGVATADSFYAAVTFLGLTVISGFIITHQYLFRFLAGVVLILIGIRVFLSVPSAITAKTEHETYLKDYLSMVALAIANPLTLVFFLVILPGYGFVIHGISSLSAAEFVAGVFFGSTVWWIVLCGSIGSVRSRISMANLGLINRVSGLLISCFGTGVLILLIMAIGTALGDQLSCSIHSTRGRESDCAHRPGKKIYISLNQPPIAVPAYQGER